MHQFPHSCFELKQKKIKAVALHEQTTNAATYSSFLDEFKSCRLLIVSQLNINTGTLLQVALKLLLQLRRQSEALTLCGWILCF